MRAQLSITVVLLVSLAAVARASGQPGDASTDGGAVYRSACAACHGTDGRGGSREQNALSRRQVPHFTDCSFTSPERTEDWSAVIRDGGPARGFDRSMPAFGDALTEREIRLVIDHVRAFCRSSSWPAGDLNFPRPLATEKAYPENETVVTLSSPLQDRDNGELRLIYERRLGSRGEFEAEIPFAGRLIAGHWNRGLGDVSAGYKHVMFANSNSGTLLSAAGSLTLPTGKEEEGLGNRLVVLEPSALVVQSIDRFFMHGQLGFDFPLNIPSALNEIFWRSAIGTTFRSGRSGRAWSPALELTGHREFEYGDPIKWDLLPQLQVTLSRRQHLTARAGVRIPAGGPSHAPVALVSFGWDWHEGGLFEGW